MPHLLIIGYNPVPTPEHERVEGGGLRCWGLARGLVGSTPGLRVTVAYHDRFRRPNHTSWHDGVAIRTWDDESLPGLVGSADSVLLSYSMGEISPRVAALVRDDQQLVLDCYVPAYVEVSARQSEDMLREHRAFQDDLRLWDQTLRRGDLFLCASVSQFLFYQGVLSALGRTNPITYGSDMVLQVPYGLHREGPKANDQPLTKLVGEGRRKLLWFGGIYPWFDLRALIDSIHIVNQTTPTRLVIVGAKNPFNDHTDFVQRYQDLQEYANQPRNRGLVVMRDWVDYRERADWYLDADLVAMVNRPGTENMLSWRTRLVDFVWADLPIVTNGGDPLGEALIAAGAAARFDGLSPDAMAQTLTGLLANPAKLDALRGNVREFKRGLHWDEVTRPLGEAVLAHRLAADVRLKRPERELRRDGPNDPVTRVYLSLRRRGLRATLGTIRTRLVGSATREDRRGAAPMG